MKKPLILVDLSSVSIFYPQEDGQYGLYFNSGSLNRVFQQIQETLSRHRLNGRYFEIAFLNYRPFAGKVVKKVTADLTYEWTMDDLLKAFKQELPNWNKLFEGNTYLYELHADRVVLAPECLSACQNRAVLLVSAQPAIWHQLARSKQWPAVRFYRAGEFNSHDVTQLRHKLALAAQRTSELRLMLDIDDTTIILHKVYAAGSLELNPSVVKLLNFIRSHYPNLAIKAQFITTRTDLKTAQRQEFNRTVAQRYWPELASERCVVDAAGQLTLDNWQVSLDPHDIRYIENCLHELQKDLQAIDDSLIDEAKVKQLVEQQTGLMLSETIYTEGKYPKADKIAGPLAVFVDNCPIEINQARQQCVDSNHIILAVQADGDISANYKQSIADFVRRAAALMEPQSIPSVATSHFIGSKRLWSDPDYVPTSASVVASAKP